MTNTAKATVNKEAHERRRRFAANDLRMARSYTRKAAETDGYLQSTYHQLASQCYMNAYKWKRKSDIPVIPEV